MKDLFDCYLSAVERRLPKAESKDIIAELREAISAKIEAREAELGHPAEADDIAAILKSFGHPVVVAARYSGREALIGAQLYPWFWPAQKMTIGIGAGFLIAFTAIGAMTADRPVARFVSTLGEVWNLMIFLFGAVTLVFIALESSGWPAKIGAGWDPKTLPQDHIRAPRSLFETLFTLAFDVIFILWWVKWVDFPNDVPSPGNSIELHFASAWAQVYTPVLVLALVTAAVHIADIVHPAWSRLRSAVSILGHIGGLVVLWVLFRAGPLVSVTSAAEEGERAAKLADTINGVFGPALGIVGLFWAIGLGVEVWRQIQATRPAASPPASFPQAGAA